MTSLHDFCAERAFPLEEWDTERNAPLTPDAVAYGSKRQVWWRCPKGHSYRAALLSRTQGTGCPYCAGKRPVIGENDLASAVPELAAEWDERNHPLTPQSVTANSNRAVWWRCQRGHSYRATVAHRVRQGTGCPYCAGRRVLAGFNDLETLHPKAAAQWHPTLNGALTPSQVTAGSHRRVWWQCPAGHVWQAVVYSRTGRQAAGCPVCAGRVKEPRSTSGDRKII